MNPPSAPASVPLTIVSRLSNQHPSATIAIADDVMSETPQKSSYWFVVLDRTNLKVVYNELQHAADVAPSVGALNSTANILIVATLGVGLDRQPRGELFEFLDKNGAGRELRRVNQVAEQLNCGSLGTFGYALVSVLGNANGHGFEGSQIHSPSTGPILTVQLMSTEIDGHPWYTPVALSNA